MSIARDKVIKQCMDEGLALKVASTASMALDYTGEASGPDVPMVYPMTTEALAQFLRCCHRAEIPVVTVGGATNLNQNTVPFEGCVAVSVAEINDVYEVDTFNRYAIVGAGCKTADFVHRVENEGLYFPQNIASASHASIGGNLAIASGSPRSLLYGQTKEYVLNLEVVLADGTIVQTGKNVSKVSSGYNLTQLFIGSEGTLGIITKATIKLRTLPAFRWVVQLSFLDFDALFGVFEDIFRKGYEPSSMEFLDASGVHLVQNYLGKERNSEQSCMLWLEWEGSSEAALQETVGSFVKDFEQRCPIRVSRTEAECRKLLDFRSKIGYAVKQRSRFKDIDVVVPRSEIREIYNFITEACDREKFYFTAFAHIGDGNLHVNILQDNTPPETWKRVIPELTRSIILKAVELGGAVSGEHGIGRTNRSIFHELTPEPNKDVMRGLKRLLDPKGILNSGILIGQKNDPVLNPNENH